MKKRLIDCTARELAAYTKEDLLRAITESEGRVLATEEVWTGYRQYLCKDQSVCL